MKRSKRIIGLYLALLLLGTNILQVSAEENLPILEEEKVQQEMQQSDTAPETEAVEEAEMPRQDVLQYICK